MAAYNAYTYQNPYLANGYYYPQAPVFQPYNYPMQGQNQMPQTTQQNQTQAQFTNIWFNGGENEARMYPVAPNNAVALWSETDPVIYLKKADASGKPEFKIYDLVERKEADSSKESSVEYVTKEDFSGIINGMTDLISSFKTEIESMKSDIYGLAGKKKIAVKKTEVDEDV